MGKTLPAAWKASIPVLFGYLPLGIAFGLLFNTLGYPWGYAALSGLVVFAGSAQFLSVSLLASHSGLWSIFMTTLFLNLRHMFYGFSMFNRFSENRWLRPYLIFGLTDESYSVMTATKFSDKLEDELFCFWVTVLDHAYWVTGCALGAIAGRRLHVNTKGLDFVLTALFVVLTIEQALTVKTAFPFLIAALAGAAALLLCPSQMLLISLALVFATLLARSPRSKSSHG